MDRYIQALSKAFPTQQFNTYSFSEHRFNHTPMLSTEASKTIQITLPFTSLDSNWLFGANQLYMTLKGMN